MTPGSIQYFEYWTQDVRKDGVPFPKFAEWFGDDEKSMRECTEICRRYTIELRYWSDDMPASMMEESEALEAKHLNQIGRPSYHGKDGWRMVGAFDTEDGEICLLYSRPIQQEGLAP
ncbi:hypothetical protein GOB93_14115 [Acetobacter musti]|uniref:Uncharacterized protein n=1 Tax=Acetobacter musti TaxID=864732 RepID=A0ABX0JSK2_9PROT|nr:hypothetical protein [Acetobacter musti]NHN85768.1 hypothetical protein [Acetobacter musti]